MSGPVLHKIMRKTMRGNPLHGVLQAGGGSSGWDDGLLNGGATFDATASSGTGSADYANGTLTLYGDTSSNRAVANFLLTLTAGASYRLTFTVRDDVDTRQVVTAVSMDANTAPGFGTVLVSNLEEGTGAQSFDFVAEASKPYLQFFTANLTGTWVCDELKVVAL